MWDKLKDWVEDNIETALVVFAGVLVFGLVAVVVF